MTSTSPRRRGRPPGPGSTERTRTAIVRSARRVFSKLGYERATVRDIADGAGVTRPAVNHHFAGKRALYQALLDKVVQDMSVAGRDIAAQGSGPQEKIRAFLHVAIEMDRADRSITRFVVASMLDSFRYAELTGAVDDQLDQVRGFLGLVLYHGIESGDLRRDLDVEPTVEMLVATMWGMASYGAYLGTHEQLEAAVAQFGRLLEGTLW